MPLSVDYRVRLPTHLPKSEEFKLSDSEQVEERRTRFRTRSEMRDMKVHKSQNYAQLRKTYENDFYVGNKKC